MDTLFPVMGTLVGIALGVLAIIAGVNLGDFAMRRLGGRRDDKTNDRFWGGEQ